MHFSRVRLNPTRRETRHLITSAQAMHATVMGAHPPDGRPDVGRVLWRLDHGSSHELQLYVLSPRRPDFTGLLESAGWPTALTWDTADYGQFLTRLSAGQQWRFRLTANPVRSVKRGDGGANSRGRVSPHLTVSQQEAWLLSRSTGWGFTIPENTLGAPTLTVRERHTAEFGRNSTADSGGRRRDRVSITRATYEGVLEVTDRQLLTRALTHGMGRAKAYGCGLMTLAPVT